MLLWERVALSLWHIIIYKLVHERLLYRSSQSSQFIVIIIIIIFPPKNEEDCAILRKTEGKS